VLKETVPATVTVGMLWNATSAAATQHAIANQSASALGLTVANFDVQRPEDVAAALDAALAQRVDALCVDRVPVTFARLADIVAFAERHRIVAIYPDRDWVLAGGLMAYGRDIRAYRRRVADR
jgi:putative ABC transport system substrate-binding protein